MTRKLALAAVLAALIAGPALAASNTQNRGSYAPASDSTVASTRPQCTVPLGYQQITSLSAAAALTVPSGATVAYIVVETQGVRWRDDGTNPTASVGNPVGIGQQLVYGGAAGLAAIRFIQQAASATIDVEYCS